MIYNQKYYLRHLSYSDTPTEGYLNQFRAGLVDKALEDSGNRETASFLVDYGCSHGAFLEQFEAYYDGQYDCVGVDINPYCVAHCNVVNGVKAVTPDMFEYFYKDKHIDIMTFWDVLEHLPNPKELLDTFKPTYICTSLPCLDGFLEAFPGEDLQLWKHTRKLEHLWDFTADSFHKYMEICGYTIIYKTFSESKIRVDSLLKDKNIMSFVAKRL